jgi:hypothetical protein
MSGMAQQMAQSGLQMGQALGQGYSNLAGGFSGMMQSRVDRKRREEIEREAQELLKQHANNPSILTQISQKYKVEGNDPLAQVFANAAQAATTKATEGRQQGMQGGLMYITQAASRGVPLEQLQEGVRSILNQGGTQDQIMDAYKTGVEMRTGASAKLTTVPAGSSVVRQTPEGDVKEVYRAPFKPQAEDKTDFKYMERKDGSIMVLANGRVLQTIPAPEKVGNQSSAMNVITKSVFMQNEIAKLANVDDFWEAGVVGKALASVWAGSDAYDRDRDIMNIKANLGLEQINEMKRLAKESGASGTGLGQVSNIEFMSLQSTVDSLDVGMSAEAQVEALQNIDRHLKVIQKLASGVASQDAIEWNRPEYKVAGYHKDEKTGKVFYAPDGKDGDVYELESGSFTKIRG